MLGCKIVCCIDENDVVCEVAGYSMYASAELCFYIPVYHKGMIEHVRFHYREKIKVIERPKEKSL